MKLDIIFLRFNIRSESRNTENIFDRPSFPALYRIAPADDAIYARLVGTLMHFFIRDAEAMYRILAASSTAPTKVCMHAGKSAVV